MNFILCVSYYHPKYLQRTQIRIFLSLDVTQSVQIPVLIGSGVTQSNVEHFFQAGAMIIGSHFKKDGHWANDVDEERVKKFMEKVYKLRG